MNKVFDSHIHLDQFSDTQITAILNDLKLCSVLAVATDLASCQRLLALKQRYPHIHIAAGFHPEQPLPSEVEQQQLFDWIAKNRTQLTACGEVGLPHYRQREHPNLDYRPYIALLEQFIRLSKRYDLPINLHIVYDDALIALELLAKYQIKKAHFHWFKANDSVIEKLLASDYVVSITPDILWNVKTQAVVKRFPIERLLIETDAPWQHQGFAPHAISEQLLAVVEQIAALKSLPTEFVAHQTTQNALKFYAID
ncbi:deoxyribonuclease [[Actinobacillus] muris]|uniref:Deoxyribonuclease n=1 Tax=Muribacter muris TaxID=67855 RepID=A0A0J5S4F8_9PAST|nr:TatD family hydrolase [Muribacter muris]KMK51692.1 deoxyribonuclease [[Actinobacillus] muris] [Muribacter muris]